MESSIYPKSLLRSAGGSIDDESGSHHLTMACTWASQRGISREPYSQNWLLSLLSFRFDVETPGVVMATLEPVQAAVRIGGKISQTHPWRFYPTRNSVDG